jgi:hypothetical protein
MISITRCRGFSWMRNVDVIKRKKKIYGTQNEVSFLADAE